RFLCANGHPMKEGQQFCTVCGAGVFAGERAPARAKRGRWKQIVLGAVAFAFVVSVIGALAGPKTPKAQAPTSSSIHAVVSDSPTPTYTPPPVHHTATPTPTPTHHASPKPTDAVHQ